jgi:hypothetical protein
MQVKHNELITAADCYYLLTPTVFKVIIANTGTSLLIERFNHGVKRSQEIKCKVRFCKNGTA